MGKYWQKYISVKSDEESMEYNELSRDSDLNSDLRSSYIFPKELDISKSIP